LTAIARTAGALILAIAAFCIAPSPGHADDASDRIAAAVERAFRPLLEQHDVSGMAVAVTVDGRQHFFSYGVASKDAKAPVTQDTLFEIGSVSKTFTATLAAYAQALGKLSLDDHPGKYMPQLQGSAIDAASLLHLGTYTAGGLPLQLPDTVDDIAAMTAYFRDWKPSAAPGAQRRYSNPSLGLFGHLAGLAMNGKVADLMETEIFPKLGLKNSHVRVPEAAMARYAWGYDKAGKPIRVKPAVFDAEAYGVKTSAADLIRYVEAQINPETLEAPLRRAVEATHIGHFRVGEMVQGLGWEQYPWPVTLERLLAGNSTPIVMEPNQAVQLSPPQVPSGPTLFNKTGSTNGFGAYVAFVPAKKIGIAMLANRNFSTPARITAAHAVLQQLAR
jgi:beta-lactamase class C